MIADLPACPFCGDLASVENYITEACARCAGCGATITRRHAPEWDSGVPAVTYAWKRRTPPADHSAPAFGAATEGQGVSGREVDLAALFDQIMVTSPDLPHQMARLNGELDALVDNENEAWPPNYVERVDELQALARRLGLDERALAAAVLDAGQSDPRPLPLLYAAALVRRLIERDGQTFSPEPAPRLVISRMPRAAVAVAKPSEATCAGNPATDEQNPKPPHLEGREG